MVYLGRTHVIDVFSKSDHKKKADRTVAVIDSRLTEADAQALSSMITGYIRETPGVLNVEDVVFTVSGRRLCYSCTVRTAEGTAAVSYKV